MTDLTTNIYQFQFDGTTLTYDTGIWLPTNVVSNIILLKGDGTGNLVPSGIDLSAYSLTLNSYNEATITFTAGELTQGTDYQIWRDLDPIQMQDIQPGASITATDLNFPREVDYVIWYDQQYLRWSNTPRGAEDANPFATRGFLPDLSSPVNGVPQTWSVDQNGAFTTVGIAQGGTTAELKLQLASTTSPTGASLVGTSNGTVDDAIVNLLEQINTLKESSFPVGKVIAMMANGDAGPVGDATTPPGYIWINATNTVGSAASGATSADDKYEALFKLMWRSVATPSPFVSTGGWYIDGTPGASADADWSANKKLLMPPMNGGPVCAIGGSVEAGSTVATYGGYSPAFFHYQGYHWYICYGVPA